MEDMKAIPDDIRVLDLTVGQLRQVLAEQHQLGVESQDPEVETVPIEKLCALTGWSKSCVYKKCSLRTIPHSKVDGELRFDMKEINEWIKSKKRKTGDEVVMEFENKHKTILKVK